jgi:hypothetical protein
MASNQENGAPGAIPASEAGNFVGIRMVFKWAYLMLSRQVPCNYMILMGINEIILCLFKPLRPVTVL